MTDPGQGHDDSGRLPAKPLTAQAAPYAFRCTGCDAVTETDTPSDRCPVCGAAVAPDPERPERVAPEAVVPFGLDRDAAREALREWTASRWFAPSDLKRVTRDETAKGTYLPHWVFSARTATDYSGERGVHHWQTRTTTDANGATRTERVRKTRWDRVTGTVRTTFSRVLVPATTHVTAKRLESLHPWPLDMARPCQPAHLAGHQTLRYDVGPDDAFRTARQEMAGTIEAACRQDIGGDEQRLRDLTTRYADLTHTLVLLPVWFLTYLHRGKTWHVMVNARTAEVIGRRPYSLPKLTTATILPLTAAALLAYLTTHH